ncbi:MAG: hypothetical protein ACOY0T_28280 [Myxococcota bacterium]
MDAVPNGGLLRELEGSSALIIDGVFSPSECRNYVAGLYAARAEWTSDFGDEQFSLGRAFYTHFEQDRCKLYFADARASDARVERWLPGLQRRMLELVERVTGGVCFARRGFCGPGVHVFPAGEKVAREGGVIHFDTEGLPEHHCRSRKPALSVVAMLQPPETGGGLKLWGVRYAGHEFPDAATVAKQAITAEYRAGSAIVFDSYRLHQIQAFGGKLDRISATVHAAEVDRGRWETWF